MTTKGDSAPVCLAVLNFEPVSIMEPVKDLEWLCEQIQDQLARVRYRKVTWAYTAASFPDLVITIEKETDPHRNFRKPVPLPVVLGMDVLPGKALHHRLAANPLAPGIRLSEQEFASIYDDMQLFLSLNLTLRAQAYSHLLYCQMDQTAGVYRKQYFRAMEDCLEPSTKTATGNVVLMNRCKTYLKRRFAGNDRGYDASGGAPPHFQRI